MKILIVSDYRTGGAAYVAKSMGFILEKDHNINYFFGKDYFEHSLFNYLINKRGGRLLYEKMLKIRPNVIMLHNFDNILSPFILYYIKKYKDNYNVKVIMTLHDYHILSPSNSLTYYRKNEKKFFDKLPDFKALIFNRIDKRSYFHGLARLLQWWGYYSLFRLRSVIDQFICPSMFMYEKALQLIEKDKLHLIYNPSKAIKKNLTLTKPNDKIVVTFVGRLTEEKGIKAFLTALVQSEIKVEKKIVFQLIGTGDLHIDLEKLIANNTIKNIEIVLLGQLQNYDVLNELMKSHYVLLPSICYENAPLSLVEGAMCGCKIITMNYGGMKEIAEKQEFSFLLNDFNFKTLSDLIEHVIKYSDFKTSNQEIEMAYSEVNYLKMINELI